MRWWVVAMVCSSVRAHAQPVLGPAPPPPASAQAPPAQPPPVSPAPAATTRPLVAVPAPPEPRMFEGRPFRIAAHLVPFEQSSGSTPPVRPFGMMGVSAELAPVPWFAVDAGIGFTSSMHAAAFAHLRLPLARHAIGIAGGLSRGGYTSRTESYDCVDPPLSSVRCESAWNTYDGSTWASVMGELEYRHPALRGVGFRLAIGISQLLKGTPELRCSNTNQAECAMVAPEVDSVPGVTLNIGYAFGPG